MVDAKGFESEPNFGQRRASDDWEKFLSSGSETVRSWEWPACLARSRSDTIINRGNVTVGDIVPYLSTEVILPTHHSLGKERILRTVHRERNSNHVQGGCSQSFVDINL